MASIRSRVVVWYLALLAALLFGLCVVQTVTLTGYFLSSRVQSMQQVAGEGLALAGPCFIRSPTDLQHNAQAVAQLLGSHEVGAVIVTPGGQILARNTLDPGGVSVPINASPSIVRRLISAEPAPSRDSGLPQSSCTRTHTGSPPAAESVRSGNILFLATPLGLSGHPVGYAILARSMAAEDATLRRVRLTLILGAISLLLIAAAVALPIIRRALQPLHRVTAAAEAIAGGDLEQRAHLRASTDEVARLGKAFDTMVDRLQAAMSASNLSEERMRRFLADASHELRTPLTVLRGTSQLLLRYKELDEEETAVTVGAIHDEAVRLSGLVDDLLTLTKADAGVQHDLHAVTISRFLQDFVTRYASAWPGRTIELHTTELNGAQANVDPEALRRVLTNLVDNSARYSMAGRPITVAGRIDSGTVSLLVKDDGPGLSAEDAEHVFERFYRGNKSRARVSGGSGLGLAIVHALVQRSCGEIQIDTGPDRGTTVVITLPLMPAPVPAHPDRRALRRSLELVHVAD